MLERPLAARREMITLYRDQRQRICGSIRTNSIFIPLMSKWTALIGNQVISYMDERREETLGKTLLKNMVISCCVMLKSKWLGWQHLAVGILGSEQITRQNIMNKASVPEKRIKDLTSLLHNMKIQQENVIKETLKLVFHLSEHSYLILPNGHL